MVRVKRFVCLGLVLLTLSSHGQVLKNVSLRFKINGVTANETCMLAYYLGDKQYIADSMFANSNGEMKFESDTLHAGVYMLVFDDRSNFEFLVNEPKFSISTTKSDPIKNLKAIGSKENALFFDYLQFLSNQRERSEKIQNRTDLTEAQKNQERSTLDANITKKQNDIIKQSSHMLVGKLIKASLAVPVPNAPAHLTPTEAQSYQFYAYRKHFFDNVDLTTGHLLYSPVYHQKLMQYLEKLTVKDPDSMIASTEYIMQLASKDEEVFKYTLITLVNHFAKTKLICMDRVYVHLVDKYYLTGKASWIDEEQLQKMRSRANALRNVQCGSKAPDFDLPTPNGQTISLYKSTAQWTVLFFWKSDCGHCNTVSEQLKTWHKSSSHNLEIIAISADRSREVWLDKLAEQGTATWTHLRDTDGKCAQNYDVSSYPVIYVLDKNKIIQVKRIDVDSLDQWLQSQAGE